MNRTLLLALVGIVTGQAANASCGPPADACEIDGGTYHIELPDNADTALPAVMFLHGYGGSGTGVLRMRAMVDGLTARGYAVIAPDARARAGDGKRIWSFLPGWPGRDETDFLTRVRDDSAARFGVVADRVVLAGFSAGGFMVHYLACEAPHSFAGYAPVSGGFWRPQPERCAGPVRLLHTHGWRDTVVPIEGRALRNGAFEQGDIFAGLDVWRAANGCSGDNPDAFAETGQIWRRKWTRCDPASALELALFPGGHAVPKGWSDMVLDWFEALPPAH